MMMMMMMMMEPPEQHDGRTTDNRGHQPPLTTTYARVGNPDGRLSSAITIMSSQQTAVGCGGVWSALGRRLSNLRLSLTAKRG
jgi:hypothetical protein